MSVERGRSYLLRNAERIGCDVRDLEVEESVRIVGQTEARNEANVDCQNAQQASSQSHFLRLG